ncbi:MAG: hypothetical protein IJ848_03995 [Alphaproteobacteria bacterium]|nr:hypothetical protein [Alphaproteobacteria bacterium]
MNKFKFLSLSLVCATVVSGYNPVEAMDDYDSDDQKSKFINNGYNINNKIVDYLVSDEKSTVKKAAKIFKVPEKTVLNAYNNIVPVFEVMNIIEYAQKKNFTLQDVVTQVNEISNNKIDINTLQDILKKLDRENIIKLLSQNSGDYNKEAAPVNEINKINNYDLTQKQIEKIIETISKKYYYQLVKDCEQYNVFYYNGRIPNNDKFSVIVHMVIDICHKYLHDGGLKTVLNKRNIQYTDDTKQILQYYLEDILNNYDKINKNDVIGCIFNCNYWPANMVQPYSGNVEEIKYSNELWCRQVLSREEFRKTLNRHGKHLLTRIITKIHEELPDITNISEFRKITHEVLEGLYGRINDQLMLNFNGKGN